MHEALLHDFFDAHWSSHADRLAIDIPPGPTRPTRLLATYGELARRSHDVTRCLGGRTSPESVVAVLLPRTSIDAFASLLGVLRAGAAYTAIDPAFPDERVLELIGDAAAVAVVTDAAGAARLTQAGVDGSLLVVLNPHSDPPEGPAHARPQWLTPESLAYVIYTSGTTGRPKGVMTEHRAIANLVASDLEEFQLAGTDRVGQSSSLSYDSSIEEMWLAFAAGATLVVLDDEVARAGPDLIPWLEREAITVLCPPPTLLRATGRRDSSGLLPKLRLVYVGGEALTTDVVDVWAPGRRFVNGYGPTESAVTSVRTDVAPGQPVPIGYPISNVSARVLNEAQADCADDEVGELWLGGAGLARGYWRDPELTARKFQWHPEHGRLYRTGDRARRTSDGAIYCLGRADSQVKLRGYRIELEEIEARLAALPQVRAAACRMQGEGSRQTIVGFVIPANTAAPPNGDDLRRRLGETLPAYMVPSIIRTVASLPTTTGGKLDRAALPTLENGDGPAGEVLGPRTELESRIEAALRRVVDRHSPISVTAHFFHDLGGDSLLAAELITTLRADPQTAALTVRDAYAAPTIEQLAATAERLIPASPIGPTVAEPKAGGRPLLATLFQLIWLVGEVTLVSSAAYGLFIAAWPRLAMETTAGALAAWVSLLGIVGFAIYLPASLAAAVLVKRIVIGRYTAIRAPVWGRFYLRHWIVCQTLRLVPWRVLEGTTLQLAALRALGARIGQRVHIHRGVDLLQGGWDLLEIGDDVTIGQEAVVRLVDLEAEEIVVGPVALGDGATIETRASIAGHAVIGRNGYLTALSSLPSGAHIPAGEQWDGVPAQRVGLAAEPPASDPAARIWSPAMHGVAMLISRVVSALVMPAVGAAAFVWLSGTQDISPRDLATWSQAPVWRNDVLWLFVCAALIAVPLTVTVQALTMRVLGRLSPGVMSRWSPAYLRVWAKTDIVRRAGDWLSGTLMWPVWLRAAGMRIGKDCEISTIIDVVPELVTIGAGTFFADGVYLGGPRLHRGTVTLAATTLGSDVFLGNHVVIPAGSSIRDGILIGVSTVANDEHMTAGTSWFGHPPFALSRPSAAYVDRALTHNPSTIRYINRWIWELARFAIPVLPALVLLGFADVIAGLTVTMSSAQVALLAAPAFVVTTGLLLCAVVLLMKWLLLGRVRPGQHPLWSCWCSRWDFHYVAWGRLARPFLARFDGTLLLAWYLRAMGMRIGRRVVLGPGFAQVVDPDMIRIDDDATVHALFQAHTFEDRMLKIDRVRIRKRATVGCGAVLFYGADIGEGASVAAQSVIMKHERLAPHQRYEGCPSASVPVSR